MRSTYQPTARKKRFCVRLRLPEDRRWLDLVEGATRHLALALEMGEAAARRIAANTRRKSQKAMRDDARRGARDVIIRFEEHQADLKVDVTTCKRSRD
jgi:hypothetical protein